MSNFEDFLQNKIHPVSSDSDADHMIRKSLSICRLCYEETADAIEQVDKRLCEVIGQDWKNEYQQRNYEKPRLEKSNIKNRR